MEKEHVKRKALCAGWIAFVLAGCGLALAAEGPGPVTISGQLRHRLEYRSDFSMNDASYEDDVFDLFRERIGLEYRPERSGRIYLEGQDARSIASSGLNKTNGFIDSFDLRQAFIEWGDLSETVWQVKLGRQDLSYGNDRLVAVSDWSNTAKGFDAAKVVYGFDSDTRLDIFYARAIRVNSYQFNTPDPHDELYGTYLSHEVGRENMWDTFLFVRHDGRDKAGEISGRAGGLLEYTAGNRIKGAYNDWDYGAEYALQWGERAKDDIVAWMVHGRLGYTFAGQEWKPRIGIEYDHASGDEDPRDGKSRTFDQLFPGNHSKYGFIDLVGLKNMEDYRLSLGIKPEPKLSLSADYHFFRLDTASSAWFTASGAVARPGDARASDILGHEVDLLATYQYDKRWSWAAGYSRFFAGPFIKDTGAHDDADFFYLQTVYKF